MKFGGKTVLLALALILALVAGAQAAAEQAQMINGYQWTNWSAQDKLVYIRGITNWADFLVAAYPQKARGSEFGMSKVFVDELKGKTLGQIVTDVDAYYKENPGKMDTSVVEVIIRRCTKVCPPEAGAKEKRS